MSELRDTRATLASTPSTPAPWFAAIALMAVSVLVYVSLERSIEV